MRTRWNPFTQKHEDYPPPQTYLCPPVGRPDRKTISDTLGVSSPVAFTRLVEWTYDKAQGDPYRCVEIFDEFVGLYPTDGSGRYESTPCELFPFGRTGVDGDHYGYLVHAPELTADDYPVCHFCPMDSDGVIVEGAGTYDGLASAIKIYGKPELRPDQAEWRTALDDAMRNQNENGLDCASVVAVPPDWTFLPSADGVGVLAPSRLFGPAPIAIDPHGPVEAFIAAANTAIRDGYFATALFYLREAYWCAWTEHPVLLGELLCHIYDKLNRPSLATAMSARVEAWRKQQETS
jgi:hypothetical protein